MQITDRPYLASVEFPPCVFPLLARITLMLEPIKKKKGHREGRMGNGIVRTGVGGARMVSTGWCEFSRLLQQLLFSSYR